MVRELIHARLVQERESTYEIDAIRKALVEGENSGLCDQSVDEIWQEARLKNV